MQNGVGRRLDLEKRLELCADIAMAVMGLHGNSRLQNLDLVWNMIANGEVRYHSWGHQTRKHTRLR